MTQLAKYTVGLQFQLDKRSFSQMERQLKNLEKSLAAMQKRIQSNFSKSFTLPSLKVKKFEFDSLSLQRDAQQAINRVSRLLVLPISRLQFDQSRINQQMQNVFQRAANNAKVSVKSVAGTGGGGNPYAVHAFPRMNAFSQAGFGGGVGGGIGAMIPRIGPVGMAAGGIAAGGALAVNQINNARQLMSKREIERIQLELAVGGSKERRQSSVDEFIKLSSRIGIKAEENLSDYSRFMKQARNSMKLTAQGGFDLYQNMAIATRGNGGDSQSVQRQSLALTQIGGLGYLRAEELNG